MPSKIKGDVNEKNSNDRIALIEPSNSRKNKKNDDNRTVLTQSKINFNYFFFKLIRYCLIVDHVLYQSLDTLLLIISMK